MSKSRKSTSQPNVYQRLIESEGEDFDDGKEPSQLHKKITFIVPLKIKDEKKIDLRQLDRHSSASDESLRRMFPIEEFPEDISRASSKMYFELKMRQMENQMKRMRPPSSKPRPISRREDSRPSSFLIFKESKSSIESSVPSEFEDFEWKDSNLTTSTKTEEDGDKSLRIKHNSINKTFTANEFASFHKIANDFTMKNLSRSNLELTTIISCSSTGSKKPISCFPKCTNIFTSFCRRKSNLKNL
jgi:hypothetical protein